MLDWSLAFVLPNLRLREPEDPLRTESSLGLHQDGICIVRGDDVRLQEIRSRETGADALMGSFRSEHGQPFLPPALLVRKDVASAFEHDLSAIVAFRNAVAMSHILPGRVRLIGNPAWPTVSWSDSFDFHPTSVANNGTLYTHTPALQAYLIPEKGFQAMADPALPIDPDLTAADPFLTRNLGRLWRERFVSPRRNTLLGRLVFRSLEIAYHASSLTDRNEASLNDFGLQIALWVTALEVLARPPRGDVNQRKVMELLDNSSWDDPKLGTKRYTLRFRDRKKKWRYERGAILPKLCNNLYHARHRFVHGQGVDVEDLTPAIGKERPPLPRVAALVYRAALATTLSRRFRKRRWSLDPQHLPENLANFEYERALLSLMGRLGHYE